MFRMRWRSFRAPSQRLHQDRKAQRHPLGLRRDRRLVARHRPRQPHRQRRRPVSNQRRSTRTPTAIIPAATTTSRSGSSATISSTSTKRSSPPIPSSTSATSITRSRIIPTRSQLLTPCSSTIPIIPRRPARTTGKARRCSPWASAMPPPKNFVKSSASIQPATLRRWPRPNCAIWDSLPAPERLPRAAPAGPTKFSPRLRVPLHYNNKYSFISIGSCSTPQYPMPEVNTEAAVQAHEPKVYEDLSRIVEWPMLATELTEERIRIGCDLARQHGLAVITVRPSDVVLAQRWTGSSITLGTTIDWPHGYSATTVKQFAARDALRRGAKDDRLEEHTSELQSHSFQYLETELLQIAEACHEVQALLTVNLETPYLNEEHKIVACRIVKRAGADFLATPEPLDIALLRQHARDRIQIKLREASNLESALA